MTISDFLSAEDVLIDVSAPGRRLLLDDLARKAALRLNNAAAEFSFELNKREDLGSTGVGHGVAIPHARLRSVLKPFGMLVRLKRPIDFSAIDGEPVDIVFLLLLPATESGYLGALASVARRLRISGDVESRHRAKTAAELYSAMVS